MILFRYKSVIFLLLGSLILIPSLFFGFKILVKAAVFDTDVTVGNAPPAYSVLPHEDPVSDGTTPTNEGSNVTWKATASDPISEDYYLAICKTNAITAGVSGAAPTCGGDAWCVTTATASGVEATCSYTTQGTDAESNAWFGFVCDDNSSSASCSLASQGSGTPTGSNSPFKVNHDPTYSAIVDSVGGVTDDGADPGEVVLFTATAADADTDTANDTVKLVVCADTSGATTSGCVGTLICASSSVASNPNCSVTTGVDGVAPDGDFNYYAYVFDSHGIASASNYRTGSYTINNMSPEVISLTLNGGLDISLTAQTTTNVAVTTGVRDYNSCQDITGVETSVYRSGIGYSLCDANAEDDDNNCYAQVTCTVVGGTCTGTTDGLADYTCTVAMQYHADATKDEDLNDIEYSLQNWMNTVKVTDDDTAVGTSEIGIGVEVLTTVALDLTAGFSYGSLNLGEKNDPLDKITNVKAVGNVGIDEELSGTDMGDGGVGIIDVGYQKYALASSTAYASGVALSTTPTEAEINCLKTTNSASPANEDTWWGIEIPVGIPPGVYSGENTINAYLGEVLEW